MDFIDSDHISLDDEFPDNEFPESPDSYNALNDDEPSVVWDSSPHLSEDSEDSGDSGDSEDEEDEEDDEDGLVGYGEGGADDIDDDLSAWDDGSGSPHSFRSPSAESDAPSISYIYGRPAADVAGLDHRFDLLRNEIDDLQEEIDNFGGIEEIVRDHIRQLDGAGGWFLGNLEALGQGPQAQEQLGNPPEARQAHPHRHHPYRPPAPSAARSAGRAENSYSGGHRSQGPQHRRPNGSHNAGRPVVDELVEMEVGGGPWGRQAAQSPVPEVIDLTQDFDGPEELLTLPNNPRFQQPQQSGRAPSQNQARQAHIRNPRRQMSLNHRTPSLTRSDGSLLGGRTQVIDLTLEDEPPSAPIQAGRQARSARAGPTPVPAPLRLPSQSRRQAENPPRMAVTAAEAIDLDDGPELGALFGIVRRFSGFRNPIGSGLGLIHRIGGAFGHQPADVDVQLLGHNMMNNPLANNAPNFNYGANGYNNNRSPPKPAHVPPPPAREGFSRATHEDLTFVCPSCEEELKYDPDEEEDSNVPPAKRPRTKKDREEHHFWAVKECGHVYCKHCYENRKPGPKNPYETGFRPHPASARKLLCAVADCEAEVSGKASWVGLFL
ncbi:hypothetical protein QBC46DRAFT_375119 [Diplogelasinospora grovesii]|uniref:Cell cycle control protein n=1 Tax=Diplogelasinospora grovesii TaxID=303347 RepID=A0AAN6NEN7_9PEZI|nr:hypothetical protein QBC46DRAFT_375119 [Diplogelasinospora grovesii]